MSAHTIHTNKPGTVLFDNCPRCEEHAWDLISLDLPSLLWLGRQLEEPYMDRIEYLSVPEVTATNRLEAMVRLLRKAGFTITRKEST